MAVLAVVAFHAKASILPGGFVGVDVFFVISGFLISGIIVHGLRAGTFSFADFYARRIRRIFPALSLVLLTCAIVGWFVLLPGARVPCSGCSVRWRTPPAGRAPAAESPGWRLEKRLEKSRRDARQ